MFCTLSSVIKKTSPKIGYNALLGWQSKDAQVGLAWAIVCRCYEVFIEDALTLITALEGVELGLWYILAFFFLDVCHIKVGLACRILAVRIGMAVSTCP